MKLIKPSVEIIKQEEYDLNHIFKFIELVGRTCYKSEDKITEDSAKEFVDRMIRSGHGATLEHGTVYLTIPNKSVIKNLLIHYYEKNPYSKVVLTNDNVYITTNYRVIIENNWNDDLEYITAPTKFHIKRTTVKFICDRAIANEFVRHRVFSFAQESTRYCNYSKDKFNNELTFIEPCWLDELPHNEQSDFISSLGYTEDIYIKLTEQGWKAEEARNVLPLSLKTELIMTGFNSDWQHFFELRCAPNAHPQAKELADILKDKFNK
jgi:thymidylate synthase (FAD)